MYEFLLNMWVMGRIDQAKVNQAVTKRYLTAEKAKMILATPKCNAVAD